MEIKKVNLDRENLSSAHIERKQNFQHVLSNAKFAKPPIWKSPWFYGAVGLSSMTIAALSFTDFETENKVHETRITSKHIKVNKDKTIHASFKIAELSNLPETEEVQKKSSPKVELKKIESSDETEVNPPEFVASLNETPTVVSRAPEVKIHSELPSIAGLTSGRISVSNFLKAEQIDCSELYKIVSYSVQYFDGRSDLSVQINGNKLPSNIIEQITDYNLNQMVFFTNIKALDTNGKIRNMSPMNFKIVN